MIPYHGLPITPATAATYAISGGHAFVCFRHPDQLGLVLEVCQSFAADNGAYPAWRSGDPVTDWSAYYAWIRELMRYPSFDFAVIPDVIDGSEAENDALIAEWHAQGFPIWVGAPVWHMHEDLDRLKRLASIYPRICIGSSGEYAAIGTAKWWNRMAEAMDAICDETGRPICKVHGLRMLDPDVFTRLPLASGDSTNIGRNIGIDKAWRGTYTPPTKEARALVMRQRIEAHQSATRWNRESAPIQSGLDLFAA
jgi:hypothetical protein